MKIPISKTSKGTSLLLTDEHPVCVKHVLPVVAIGDGPEAEVLGKLDEVQTENGLVKAGEMVIEWLRGNPKPSHEARAFGLRYLKDSPEHL